MSKYILFLFSLLFLWNCNDSSIPVTVKSNEIHVKDQEREETETVVEKAEHTYAEDSLLSRQILKRTLRFVYQHISDSSYNASYDPLPGDSIHSKVSIQIGNLFSAGYRHVIVRRETMLSTLQDIYLLQNDTLKHVLQHRTGNMSFIRDTIMDINGDNINDFYVHWYPAAGCCRRDIYDVYIFRERNGTFCPVMQFMNPFFLPKQKLLRGMTYGHEPEYYTYRWRGMVIDTIEYISPDDKDPEGRTWIRGNHSIYSNRSTKRQALTEIPGYYKILSID